MDIKSNSFIVFNARTAKDLKTNTSFFLKFTVSALGFDHMLKKTLFKDLSESLTCLFGAHLARSYSERFNLVEMDAINSENSMSRVELGNKAKHSISESNASGDEESATNTTPHNLCGYQHQLSVSSMTAAISGSASNPSLGLSDSRNKLVDLNSFFYKTLLRGGFNQLHQSQYDVCYFEFDHSQITGKLTETASVDESNLKLLKFLNKVAFHFENLTSIDENDVANAQCDVVKFLKCYDKNYDTNAGALAYAKTKMGGASVTELVIRIFCVLIWHNSAITYESLFATR